MSCQFLPALLFTFVPLFDEPAIYSSELANAASVAFSPSGDWLATGGNDGQVKLWAATSCLGTKDLGKHSGEVNAIAFAPQGDLFASGDLYKTLELWKLGTRDDMVEPKRLASRRLDSPIDALVFAPDGKTLFAGLRDNAVLALDLKDETLDAEPKMLRHDYEVGALAITRDGTRLAAGDGGGTVRLYSLPDASEAASWKYDGRITALAFSKDGATLFVGSSEPKLRAIEVATGKEREGFAASSIEANALCVNAAGTEVFAGTQDNLVKRFEAESGKLGKTIEGHEGPVTSITLSPDASLLVSAGRDRMVRVTALR